MTHRRIHGVLVDRCLLPLAAAGVAALLALAPYAKAGATEKSREQADGARISSQSWGTFHKPFAANSLWNSRPVAPVLGDFVIPKSSYYPRVGGGEYSLEVFLAKPDDPPVTVRGGRAKGIWDPDSETFRESITIPRWPRDVTPAEGRDGHADIVDPVTGIVHSFNVLRFRDGEWFAGQYAWTRIDGRGWGDPAHYFQGARAAAVPSMGGLIRKHEVRDGDSLYRHALAVSLTFNALSPKPAYVFPATSADGTANRNTGAIPEGTLLMLPQTFDTQRVANPDLRKVAETLKVYGAYVVDRNVGTPFNIYVENGAEFNLHGGKGRWDTAVGYDLQRIRDALRPVVSASGWMDGDGRPFTPEKNLNLLSMRGPWKVHSGSTPGTFDTWAQAVVFPAAPEKTVQVNTSSRSLNPVSWAVPAGGTRYRLTAIATGGARLRVQLKERSSDYRIVVDSKELGDGDSFVFAWPEQPVTPIVHAISGTGRASSVRGTLVADGPNRRAAQ